MITKIAIENFKGIRDRLELDLKPITLMFGANSAGKSTVLHAIHYASEVLLRKNYDADRTALGGDFIDLGGFRSFVHARDTSLPVIIGFELDLEESDLPVFDLGIHQVPQSLLFDISGRISSAYLSVEIRWSTLRDAPYVAEYSVALNGKPLATIEYDELRGREVRISSLQPDHEVFAASEENDAEEDKDSEGSRMPSLLDAFSEYLRVPFEGEGLNVGLRGLEDALPEWKEPLDLGIDFSALGLSEKQQELFERRERGLAQPHLFDLDAAAADEAQELALKQAIHALSQAIVGPGDLLRDALGDFRFIGPLRQTPPRGYSPPRFPDEARWANGLAAWDALFRDLNLAEKTSEWLAEPELLDAGYSLQVRRTRELPEESELFAQLTSGRTFDETEDLAQTVFDLDVRTDVILRTDEGDLLPQDVGVGISQLLPVLVAALANSSKLVAIEQPELHVHPRLQAELGDVLVVAALRESSNRFLIETHSEHLILRLLRRIRESHDGELPKHLPSISPDHLAVVHLAGGDQPTEATPLRVSLDGEFVDRWPGGFFEERAEELF